jgi:hypothetical protein
MKTLTNIRNAGKNLKTIALISLMVFQVALKASELPASSEEAFETEQAVEDWMLNLSDWAKKVDTFASKDSFETETELEIEDWMIDPDHEIWDCNEEEQEIEEWMCNVNHYSWNEVSAEEEYEIEAWMTNPAEWLKTETPLYIAAY